MPTATAGVQSSIDVETSPVITMPGMASSPSTWSFIWFALAMLIIIGFHVRIFGRPIPPAATFP